jgi:xanthine phosphoribosyltransferase
MKYLQDRILRDGRVEGTDILKVDSFLNHQIDVELMNEIGKEFNERFKEHNITKILTIEASGIAIATIAAQYFKVPVVFAKKTESRNLDKDTYESSVYSFTKDKTYKIRVSKKYINDKDNVLILDDFLANGKAANGLIDIVNQSKANVCGIGIVIEKGFQDGGKKLRDNGINVQSLAIIDRFEDGDVKFSAC